MEEKENKEKALTPIYNLEPINPMDVPERNGLFLEAIRATEVAMEDLNQYQRKILISLQKADLFFLNMNKLSEVLGISRHAISNAMANPDFMKVYLYIQNAMMMMHLPDIDNATIKAAISEDGTDKDRMLAYMRLGILDKKGGLTVQIVQNNNTVNANTRNVCEADNLIDRWSGKAVEPNKFGGKKRLNSTPVQNRPDVSVPRDEPDPYS